MSTESNSADAGPQLEWLARYASKDPFYQWQLVRSGNRILYHRPLGLVEQAFDSDGRFYEGRADVHSQLTLEVRCNLSASELRERLVDTWSALRLHHPMLRAKALPTSDFMPVERKRSKHDVRFVIEKPQSLAAARKEAVQTITFLDEHYQSVDPLEFLRHAQNATRILDPRESLARLFVLPFEAGASSSGTRTVRLLSIIGHQITEGLTMVNWLTHTIALFNNPVPDIDLDSTFSPQAVQKHFPLAQETLYPQISGNRARRRWFWVITLVLRHVHPVISGGFSNPLRRPIPIPSGSAKPLTPKFSAVLDYSATPPLDSGFSGVVRLSKRATSRIQRLCRTAGTSIGAGTFALAAIVGMEFEEQRHPDTPLDKRAAFIASFPLSPRAMFSYPHPPESLMLAFSEGIKLPFLPSHLPVEGRFKLVARAADRQLRVYQKRAARTVAEEADKNPVRLLAKSYIMSCERAQVVLPPELRMADPRGPQGDLPAPFQYGRATHGISAIGKLQGLQRGLFPLDSSKDFAADFREYATGVRARDNEFLVATIGDGDHICFSVSYDGNAIDHGVVEEWKAKILGLLDYGEDVKL